MAGETVKIPLRLEGMENVLKAIETLVNQTKKTAIDQILKTGVRTGRYKSQVPERPLIDPETGFPIIDPRSQKPMVLPKTEVPIDINKELNNLRKKEIQAVKDRIADLNLRSKRAEQVKDFGWARAEQERAIKLAEEARKKGLVKEEYVEKLRDKLLGLEQRRIETSNKARDALSKQEQKVLSKRRKTLEDHLADLNVRAKRAVSTGDFSQAQAIQERAVRLAESAEKKGLFKRRDVEDQKARLLDLEQAKIAQDNRVREATAKQQQEVEKEEQRTRAERIKNAVARRKELAKRAKIAGNFEEAARQQERALTLTEGAVKKGYLPTIYAEKQRTTTAAARDKAQKAEEARILRENTEREKIEKAERRLANEPIQRRHAVMERYKRMLESRRKRQVQEEKEEAARIESENRQREAIEASYREALNAPIKRRHAVMERYRRIQDARQRRMSHQIMGLASGGIGLFGQAGFPLLNIAFASMSGLKYAGIAAAATATGELARAIMRLQDGALQSAESIGFLTKSFKIARGEWEASKAVYGGLRALAEELRYKRQTKALEDPKFINTWLLMSNIRSRITSYPTDALSSSVGDRMKFILGDPLTQILYKAIKDTQEQRKEAVAELRDMRDAAERSMNQYRASWSSPQEQWRKIQAAAMSREDEAVIVARKQIEAIDKQIDAIERNTKALEQNRRPSTGKMDQDSPRSYYAFGFYR